MQLVSTPHRIQQDAGRGGGRASTRGASSGFLQDWSRVGHGVCRVESSASSVIIVAHRRVRVPPSTLYALFFTRDSTSIPLCHSVPTARNPPLISLARYPDGDPIPGYCSQFPPLRHNTRETSSHLPRSLSRRRTQALPIRHARVTLYLARRSREFSFAAIDKFSFLISCRNQNSC
ncbi:hypothetical protein B0H12DRAFT_597200 [Mycena haematopus]|nr:hypothetical protein B0H12DRAFT_597200 [Mycena haematopus]